MSGGAGFGVGIAGGPTLAASQQGQGVAALLVMLAVLCLIFAYCCWGAPFCRSLCKRYCCCRQEDPEPDSRCGSSDQATVSTPTIILLPQGRMLVVDGAIFTQFQAETSGLDLVELGESVMRAQSNPRTLHRHQLQSSEGSILTTDTETSKDSLGSLGCFPPPTYESIYGKEEGEVPPSYSDILLHRFANLPYEIEMHEFCPDDKEGTDRRSLENCSHVIANPMGGLANPYSASPSGFSSQSFPRRVVRQPSLINNPLDNYPVDNEYGVNRTRHKSVSRRTSCNEINFVTINENRDDSGPSNRNCDESGPSNEMRHNSGPNNENCENSRASNERRVSRSNLRASTSRSQNDVMNMRNLARSSPGISQESQESRRTNDALRANRSVDSIITSSPRNQHERTSSVDERHSSTLEVMYTSMNDSNSSDHRIEMSNETVTSNSEDEPRDFQALTDIRESRV